MIIERFAERAQAGEHVFIHEVRDALSRESRSSIRVLARYAGELTARFDIPVGAGGAPEFLRRYIEAQVYNIISALGPVGLTLEAPEGDAELSHLLGSLDETFQTRVPRGERSGYGKCLNIAERMSEARGGEGRFSFRLGALPDGEDDSPAREIHASPPPETEGLRLLGIDVGGTDVKLAASDGRGTLLCRELDWDPQSFSDAIEFFEPLLRLGAELLADLPGEGGFDAVGLSWPDVISGNRICGGETAKTLGMRLAHPDDYEREFKKLCGLNEAFAPLLKPGGGVYMINDGSMAAYTQFVESGCGNSVFAHSLGTDIGSGFVRADGSVPDIPLETYCFIAELGGGKRRYPAPDVRSEVSELTGLPGTLHCYVNQRGLFRLAALRLPESEPELYGNLIGLGYLKKDGGCLTVPPEARKPFLELLAQRADEGDEAVCELFVETGRYLGAAYRECDYLLRPGTSERALYGRLIKRERCFELLCRGAAETAPEARFTAADEALASTPLMRRLRDGGQYSVAQFAQTIGAIYYAASQRAREENK